ncbi:MAG: MATE family efflux transporter [Gammaproteobacteria bacterium]|nr:MATE family efflux transporter [Gammaproteobacteria bacterium]MDX2488779.1 MATE family efflux transporter [Gammaproteobacteria bacterium]
MSENRTALIGEYKQLVKLSVPITIGQVALIATGFVDTIMAGHISPLALGAIAVGANLWIPVYLFSVGLMMAVSSMVSHYFGAAQYSSIRDLIKQSLLVSGVLGVLGFFTVRQLSILLDWIGIDAGIVPVATDYLLAVSWGIPAVCAYLALRFASEGIGYTRPMMLIQVTGLVFNIFLNYVFMFGKLGVPAMGAVGAGWATAAVMWINLLMLVLYIISHHRYADIWQAEKLKADWKRSREMLRLGLPIALTLVNEVGMFSAVGLLMGSLGVVEVAAHQIAINFAGMMFMIPLGISAATTIRVGHALGEQRPLDARFRGLAGISLAGMCMFATASIMLLLPDYIVSIYSDDADVGRMAVSLLFMAAIFQLSDGIQVSAAGALRGVKDTLYPLLVSVVAYWLIGLPFSYYLGIRQQFGPQGLWMGLVASLTLAAIWLVWRFLRVSKVE